MSTDLINKAAINESKHRELSRRVFQAMENGENFRILGIDIDNTLIDDHKIRQVMLREILGEEYDVTMQQANELYASGKPDDVAISSALIGKMLDKVYEEAEERFVGKVDYRKIYCIERFFPGTIEFVYNLLKTRNKNDFIVLVSHHNVPAEAEAKLDLMYDLFPELDGIYLPRYHDEPYGVLGRQAVSKASYLSDKVIEHFEVPVITNIHINLTSNLFLIDDSTTVLLDSLSKGANIVPYLPTAIPVYREGDRYLDNLLARASQYCDMSKVVVEKSNLDNLNKILMK